MPERGTQEKSVDCLNGQIESQFWEKLHRLGVNPDDVSVEGPVVQISDRERSFRLSVEILSAGISVLCQDNPRPLLVRDWPFTRQIGHIAWKGRRKGNR